MEHLRKSDGVVTGKSSSQKIVDLLKMNAFIDTSTNKLKSKTPKGSEDLAQLGKSIALSHNSFEKLSSGKGKPSKTQSNSNLLNLSQKRDSINLRENYNNTSKVSNQEKSRPSNAAQVDKSFHKVSSAKVGNISSDFSGDNLFISSVMRDDKNAQKTHQNILERMKASANPFIKQLITSKKMSLKSDNDAKKIHFKAETQFQFSTQNTGESSSMAKLRTSKESGNGPNTPGNMMLSSGQQSKQNCCSLSPSIESNQRFLGSTSELHFKLNTLGKKLEDKVEKCFDRLIKEAKDLKKELISNIRKTVDDGYSAVSLGKDIDLEFNIKRLQSKSKINQGLLSVLQDEIIRVRVEKDRLLTTDRKTSDVKLLSSRIRDNLSGAAETGKSYNVREETSFTKFFENSKIADLIDNLEPYSYFNQRTKAENDSPSKTNMFQQTFK